MKIPSKHIGRWSSELISTCSASLVDRIQRGAIYRSLFLTGSEGGDPQTYNKSFPFIEKLSSNLYSPVDLHFKIENPPDVGADEDAKSRRAAFQLNSQVRSSGLDLLISEASDWSLVKGKVFLKLLWGARDKEVESYLVQPEFMGVLREDLPSLERQEAFFQSTYMSVDAFDRRVAGHPDARELMRKVRAYVKPGSGTEGPDRDAILKQVIIGGTNPYQVSGQGSSNSARGVVNWLAGPAPVWDAKTLASIVRFDELWVWDTARDDWTTIQLVGDVVVEGKYVRRNIFADNATTDPKSKDDNNPLQGHHPFVEICVNPLDGYFWGRSELVNVALAQKTLNKRVDGINKLLRKQEDPPRFFKNVSSINEVAYSRLNRPGGWLADPNPQAAVEELEPEIPAGLYKSMHEAEGIFQEMADEPAVMQGKGESGVRSQAHAETLVRTATPRLKRKAMRGEKAVATVGALVFGMLRAKDPTKYRAWIAEKDAGIQAAIAPSDPLAQSPAPKMKQIEFTLADVDEDARVTVDSHSSSPVFGGEVRDLVLALVKMGAIAAKDALALLHPPDETHLIAEAERREFEQAEAQAAAIREGGPAALKAISGGKKH